MLALQHPYVVVAPAETVHVGGLARHRESLSP